MFALALFLSAPEGASPATRTGDVAIEIAGVRSSRGTLRICMSRNPTHFPDCSNDPAALRRTVSARTRIVEFTDVPVGDYAIAVFHDENNNGKLNTLLGIPREGFGFSRNPPITVGAPRFDRVAISIASGFSRTVLKMQYIL